MLRKMSDTCKRLVVGVVIVDFIIMVAGGIIAGLVTGNWISFVLGTLLGEVIAVILSIYMDSSINKALDKDADSATKYIRRTSAIRFLIMVVAILVAFTFPGVFHVIGVLLGIMALKLSAYAVPLTSKYISNPNK